MELKFKPQRLQIIRRLKNISIDEIEQKMMEISQTKYRCAIDRWDKVEGKRNIEKVQLLADALEVPIGYFYYEAVDISMNNLVVDIYISELSQTIRFNFLGE